MAAAGDGLEMADFCKKLVKDMTTGRQRLIRKTCVVTAT
jgi:hypothetical protein